MAPSTAINTEGASLVTAEASRVSLGRRLLGLCLFVGFVVPLCGFIGAIAATVWLVLRALSVASLGLLSVDSALDLVPDVGMIVGAIHASQSGPIVFAVKLLRGCCGYRVGVPQPAPRNPRGISRLEVLRVNGADHVVRIRGRDRTKPIVLYLHGGPGMTEMFVGGGATFRFDIMEDFVIVDYDQRSAAASGALNWGRIPSSEFEKTLTVEQHVEDAAAIARWLAQEGRTIGLAPQQKVYLTGGSWGSVLSLRTAAAHPELFHSPVVVRGLVTYQEASERAGWKYITDAIARSRNPSVADREAMETVRGVPAGSFDFSGREGVAQMLKQRSLLCAYGGDKYETKVAVERAGGRGPKWRFLGKMVKEAMLAPELSLLTMLTAKKNVTRTIEAMDCLWRPSFRAQPKQIAGLSVVVAHGPHDHCTDESLVEPFLREDLTVDAGQTKKLVWFERSGHAPCKEEPFEYAALLRDTWLGPVPNHGPRCRYAVKDVT